MSDFHNSKLNSFNKDHDEYISNLQMIWIWMTEFSLKDSISKEDFVIYILNNLPEEYTVILVGLENCLTSSVPDACTIKVIYKKLNHQWKWRGKMKEKALLAYSMQYKCLYIKYDR